VIWSDLHIGCGNISRFGCVVSLHLLMSHMWVHIASHSFTVVTGNDLCSNRPKIFNSAFNVLSLCLRKLTIPTGLCYTGLQPASWNYSECRMMLQFLRWSSAKLSLSDSILKALLCWLPMEHGSCARWQWLLSEFSTSQCQLTSSTIADPGLYSSIVTHQMY